MIDWHRVTNDPTLQRSRYKKKTNEPLFRRICRLNKRLNNFDYGIVIDGKAITDEDGISYGFSHNLYRTLSCKEFIKYRTGVCWDYAHYEANYFLRRLGFEIVRDSKLTFDKTFSLYYMEFEDDNGIYPTHTWLAFRLNDTVYCFESSWKSYVGVTSCPSEFSMAEEYIDRLKNFYADIGIEIYNPKIYKYLPMKPGLTPDEFMVKAKREGEAFTLSKLVYCQ